MTLKEFSSGYYRASMSVQPYDDGPAIEHNLYRYLDENVYAQTDAPVMMRVGLDDGNNFIVESEGSIPTNVLALPKKWINEADVIGSQGRQSVFVLKPGHSYILNQSRELSDRFTEAE